MKRGHSNVRLENLAAHDRRKDAVIIPIMGGATMDTVRDLPPLALFRKEWKEIGDRMNWFESPPDTNGGSLWVEFHDRRLIAHRSQSTEGLVVAFDQRTRRRKLKCER